MNLRVWIGERPHALYIFTRHCYTELSIIIQRYFIELKNICMRKLFSFLHLFKVYINMNDSERRNKNKLVVNTHVCIYARNYRKLTCIGLEVAVTKARGLPAALLVVVPLAVRNLESTEVIFRADIFLVSYKC